MNASARFACWVLLATLTPIAPARPQGPAPGSAPGSDVESSESDRGIVYRYEGTFTQMRELTLGASDLPAPFAGDAARYRIGVSQNYEVAGRLLWSTDQSRARTFGEIASAVYVPADGEITVTVHADGRSRIGACTYEGSKTFSIRELPPAALRYLQLEVAANGQYKLMLGMISAYLQFQLDGVCDTRVTRRRRQTVDINDAAVALGAQQGTVTNEAIVGETTQPIVDGRDRYTGRWEFRPSGAAP